MRGLSRRDAATLSDLANALLPEGHGLPGADSARVGPRLADRLDSWRPRVRSRIRFLIRAWEWSSVFSRHRRRFTSLPPSSQKSWAETCYRSRITARRLHLAGLKQLIFIEWASAPEVEDVLGYDYRCRRDDEAHGATRPVAAAPAPVTPLVEPENYTRPGPAIAEGTIPIHLVVKRDFRPVEADAMRLSTVTWPEISDGLRERVDAVVVGSGAGGAVVATHLAEAGLNVLVLEEGAHVTTQDFEGPMFDRLSSFCRDHGTTQVLGNPPIPLPLGRVVGGTTVVNSGTCFRAPQRVLRRWEREHGVHADGLDDRYEAIEDFLNVRPVPWELLGPNGMAAHRGAVALGYSGGPLLRNIADCHGCGQCAFGCPTNAKQAMHISYLPRAQRAGARIYSRVRVERIVHANGRAVGVEATLLSPRDRSVGKIQIDADNVVVCAGAIYTPGLLNGSDVPDPSGQTGHNLRIHPATGVGGYFDEDVVNWKGTLQSYYIDQFFDSHELMFEATTTIPSIGAGSLPGIGERAIEALADFRRLATLGFYVSDTSRGRVRRMPGGDAVAYYRLNELDARRMGMGIAIAARVLMEAGATRVYPGLPGLDVISARADVEQLEERTVRARHLKLTAFHPMGTARMGANAETSVVDPHGRHHGLAGLWVADASTFPSCVGVNPQMTIMAFATRTAETIASS